MSHESESIKLPAHLAFTQALNCPIKANLSNSCAQSLSIQQLCELSENKGSILEQIGNIDLRYAPIKGGVELRKHIIEFHQRLNHHQTDLDEENVLTFCGAQEALATIYQCLLQPNDEVVVITPNYPSLTNMVEHYGGIVRTIDITKKESALTIDDFSSLVNEKTKLIVINSPHNPTGAVIDSTLAQQIVTLAKRYACYLLADDVSQASNYYDLPLSHAYLDYEKAIVVSVLSKSFGLSGLRIGWVVTNSLTLLTQLLSIKSYQSICCSTVDESLACLAFINQEKIIDANNQLIKENIETFEHFVRHHEQLFSWVRPKAGFLALVSFNNDMPIELWAKQVAKETGILILPSTLFGLTGQYFRLGLGQSNFSQLLEELSSYIEKAIFIESL